MRPRTHKGAIRYSVSRTSFSLHTSTSPSLETLPPWEATATVTRQPFIVGSFRLTLAFGASGPACRTVFASAVTVTVVTGVFRLFTMVRAAAARDWARAAARRFGRDPAGVVTGGPTGARIGDVPAGGRGTVMGPGVGGRT